MKFFAEYICSHPDLIKQALADRQTDRQTVELFFCNGTNLQNGLVNNCTVNGHKTYVRMLIRLC